jgi:hypothetical protein
MRGRQTLYPNMRRDSNRPSAAAEEVTRGGKRRSRRGFSLLIPRARTIICIYTDWGNLKIVSCRAWFQGLDPVAQRSAGGMDALGASIFTLKRTTARSTP